MKYRVIIMPVAEEDLRGIPRNLADSILRKIDALKYGLPGSVKRLADLDYGYRLRLADYRILFDLEGGQVTIRRVLHRRHAYASKKGEQKRKGQH